MTRTRKPLHLARSAPPSPPFPSFPSFSLFSLLFLTLRKYSPLPTRPKRKRCASGCCCARQKASNPQPGEQAGAHPLPIVNNADTSCELNGKERKGEREKRGKLEMGSARILERHEKEKGLPISHSKRGAVWLVYESSCPYSIPLLYFPIGRACTREHFAYLLLDIRSAEVSPEIRCRLCSPVQYRITCYFYSIQRRLTGRK